LLGETASKSVPTDCWFISRAGFEPATFGL
jgi:hypothetical protein